MSILILVSLSLASILHHMSGSFRFTSLLFLLPLAVLLPGCGNDGGGGFTAENRSNRGYNPGVGPFDSRGNYVERWADDKSKGSWWRKSTVAGTDAVASTKPTPPVIASNTPPIPQPPTRPSVKPVAPVGGVASTTPQAKPKPKPTSTVRVKPKRKPPIRYTVKKGDTLWGLSRKYKTSVTAIQRANGLKGTNLRIGRRLLIPRY